MASRKPKETAVETEVVVEETAQVTEEVAETPAEETVAETVEAEAPVVEKTKKAKTTEPEMSSRVKEILQVFSRLEEVYITPAGAPFETYSKLAQQQGAILYKNPYYKK